MMETMMKKSDWLLLMQPAAPVRCDLAAKTDGAMMTMLMMVMTLVEWKMLMTTRKQKKQM